MVDIPLTAPGRLLTKDDEDPAARFTESGSAVAGLRESAAEVGRWLAERREAHRFTVNRVPFAELGDWYFEPDTGNLVHRSGKFFSLEGVEVRTDYGPVERWTQPIINQPEIGMLGMVVKEFDGVLHCLVQAKMEPGNINTLQLSPTVQATRSNYTRVHGGTRTRYLEYFVEPGRARPLVDVLQSEQGAWFLGKRNRNIVVEVTEDVPPHEDYRWMTLGEIHRMLHVDNLVNMDARTVLSCIPFGPPEGPPRGGHSAFGEALRRSLSADEGALYAMRDVLSWFAESKTRYERRVRRLPLREVDHWRRDGYEISHVEGKHFAVIGARVEAGSREVTSWTQPLLAPRGQGVVAFLTKRIDGVLHVLVHARIEAGYLDVIELAPTVQCMPDNYRDVPVENHPPFLGYVLRVDPERVRYDVVQSEEGGRFYHAECRYVIVEVEDDFPIAAPADYRWLTLDQITRLLQHSHYLNVQARSLVACLHSLW